MSDGARSTPVLASAAAVIALVIAGCDLVRGPISGSQVDASVDRVVGPAIPAFVANDRFGSRNEVTVLDHLDSAAMLDRLPGDLTNPFPSGLEARGDDTLPIATRSAIEGAVQGRVVRFLPNQGGPALPDDPACEGPEPLGTFVSLGMFVLLGGHGDGYLVAIETRSACPRPARWAGAVVSWQPGGASGGEWVVTEVIDAGTSR